MGNSGLTMGVRGIDRFLEQWEMDVQGVHQLLIVAPTPRERGLRQAIWLLAQGWTAAAEVLARDPHTIRRCGIGLRGGSLCVLAIQTVRGSPTLDAAQQAELQENGR